jgi:ABC-type multidrug transport system ATPase subunit
MPAAVEIEGLTKRFGGTEALSKVTLAIETGLVAGLIGPDGAGKSTLLRLLIGLLLPSSGTIRVAGFDVARDAAPVKDRIGYMPQHFSLYGDLSVAENMKFFADLYGVRPAAFRPPRSKAAWPATFQAGCRKNWLWPAISSTSPKSFYSTSRRRASTRFPGGSCGVSSLF